MFFVCFYFIIGTLFNIRLNEIMLIIFISILISMDAINSQVVILSFMYKNAGGLFCILKWPVGVGFRRFIEYFAIKNIELICEALSFASLF